HRIIEEYYATAVHPNRPYAMAEILIPAEEVQQWHIDCLRKGVKAFLYVTDVTEAQGPLRFIRGSHLPDAELDRQIYRVGRCGLGPSYYDDQTNARLDVIGESITAPANTLMLFDNRAKHAGSLCRDGMRIALVNGFRPTSSIRINP